MNRFLVIPVLILGSIYEGYRYLRNTHRSPLSDKLEEAIKTNTDITVFFKIAGYRWSILDRLVKTLTEMGVTQYKVELDDLIAVLTISQIEELGGKRWIKTMWTADERQLLEEQELRYKFERRADQSKLKPLLEQLHEKYEI